MKIEVMVDKDNTHFSYMFECDKIVDGTSHAHGTDSLDKDRKLVILRKVKDEKKVLVKTETNIRKGEWENEHDVYEAIAVFNTWTFWHKIDDDAKKCFRCGRYEKLIKNNLCQQCIDRLPDGAK